MPDPIFSTPRIAQVYDSLEADRGDLDAYEAIVEEFQASSVLDVGCGTGTFACRLASSGVKVVGVDPARASLDVARRKPGAELVKWVEGEVPDLPPMRVDIGLMTGNVAQVFIADEQWARTLRACWRVIRPGGKLVFEIRDPAREEWLEWSRETTFETLIKPDDPFDYWVDLLDVRGSLVTFRQTFRFHSDGDELISDSTLRFRSKEEVEAALHAASFHLSEVRNAPDRPDQEFVFIAQTLPRDSHPVDTAER